MILEANDFVSQRGIVKPPHSNALPVDSHAVNRRRVKDLDNVAVLENLF